MDNRANCVYVTLMGKLEIKFKDYILTSDDIRSKKLGVSLAYFLYNHKRMVTLKELENLLFEEDELINPMGAVKNLIYRLRRFLKEIWPEKSFLETKTDGYKWNGNLEIDMDIDKIDELIKGEDSCEDWREKLEKWRVLYKNNFLSKYTEIGWVNDKRIYYKDRYFYVMKSFYEIMDKGKYYKLMQEASRYGMSIYSEDESFYYWFIHSCICMEDWGEARKAYNELIAKLYDGDDSLISDSVRNLYQKLQFRESQKDSGIDNFNREINEVKKEKTALFCSKNVFNQLCDLEQSRKKREGVSSSVILLTWNYKRKGLEQGNSIDGINKSISDIIQSSIRASDAFTKYSENQFLILLFGSIKEGAERASERLGKRINNIKLGIRCDFEIREI